MSAETLSDRRLREIFELRNPSASLRPTVAECCEMARELLERRPAPSRGERAFSPDSGKTWKDAVPEDQAMTPPDEVWPGSSIGKGE